MPLSAHPDAQDDPEPSHGERRFFEPAVATTGLNRLFGEPIWRFPALEAFVPIFGPPVATLGFRTLGAFDAELGPGGGNAPALSPEMPGSTVLASHMDPLGLSFVGLDPASVPPEVLNVPIHRASVLVDEHGVTRSEIPCADDSPDPASIYRSAPCGQAVTLNQWMRAYGRAVFQCFRDGSARATLTMRRLRPNRLYTVWAVVEDFESGPQFLIRPVPFGGVPNVTVTDRYGRASISRDLMYCPHDEDHFLGIVVVLRSNGENFGGVPVPFLNQQDPFSAFEGFAGQIPGSVAHVHLSVNVHGVPIDGDDEDDD